MEPVEFVDCSGGLCQIKLEPEETEEEKVTHNEPDDENTLPLIKEEIVDVKLECETDDEELTLVDPVQTVTMKQEVDQMNLEENESVAVDDPDHIQFPNSQDETAPPICSNNGQKYKHRTSPVQQLLHKKDKPFQCSICEKSFTKRYNFNLHKLVHTGEKPHECLQCNKRFAQRSHLITHQRIHTGEKPYECSECERRFTDQATLISHSRTHSGEKPFECLDCKKRFASQQGLKRHQQSHTKRKPHECLQCNKKYADRSNLKKHQRKHARETPT